MNLFTRKSLAQLDQESERNPLRRSLGRVQLVALGVGSIIGTGIFVMTGTAASQNAGPALVLSMILTTIGCAFSGLCYAEFAAMVPIAGSAYTYAYATIGEFVAWIIGWDLILEYAVGNVAVAISWSDYFKTLLAGMGMVIPRWLATGYRTALLSSDPAVHGLMDSAPHVFGFPVLINLPACGIVLAITWLLVLGVRESARANNIMVAVKLVALTLFIVVGAQHINPANYHPFAPNGFTGIHHGAAIVFFAYIGFDAISTAAEETKNPQRNLPIGILGGLAICTLIYVVVGFVLTGMVPYTTLGSTADPLSFALTSVGMTRVGWLVALGAVFSMSAVLLVFQYGQPRIFFAMARDGLLPKFAAKVHGKYRTPYITTIITGVFVASWALIGDANETYDLTNIGTLFAFILVCGGVVVLRFTEPERPRPFRVPFLYFIAPLGAALCLFVMWGLPHKAWVRFGFWLVIGLALYFAYGYRNSTLRTGKPPVSSE